MSHRSRLLQTEEQHLVTQSLQTQLRHMLTQFSRLCALHPLQHWTPLCHSSATDYTTSNTNTNTTTQSSAKTLADRDIRVWRLNSAGLNALDQSAETRRWPCVKAVCRVNVTPEQLLRVLWDSDLSACLLGKSNHNNNNNGYAVSLHSRVDLWHFDSQTKLVWSKFSFFPWARSSSSNSSHSNLGGELLSLSHWYRDKTSQSIVLLSQSVTPTLAAALTNLCNHSVKETASAVGHALQSQPQRSQVLLSITLLSPVLSHSLRKNKHSIDHNSQHDYNDDHNNIDNNNEQDQNYVQTELTQLSQTQWKALPAMLVWRSVGSATLSYLRSLQRLAPSLVLQLPSL